jgi:mannose-6-phosphate isomerase-like protein (cupin superfamily)
MATETEAKGMWTAKYEKPASMDRPKVTVNLGRTELLRLGVQVVQPKGGETNMHAHSALDSAWLVLAGKAKFYGYGDSLIGELGKYETIFIPKGVPYWFEALGDEPLEILHINAMDKTVPNERVDYAPPAERQAVRGGTGGRVASEEERQAAALA